MAVRTGMALTAMLFFTACGKEQDNNTVFYIDDNPVSREEYEMLAQENCNQIYMKYSTEEVNSKDFWTTEKDGETPAKQLEEKILEQLKENYTVKEAAKDLKVTEDYTYQELMEQKEEKYYKYWYSNLKTDVVNQWVKENAAVTDESCSEYYQEHIEDFTYEVGVNILYTEIPSNDENAEQEAQAIYQTLTNEQDAEAAVRQYANAETDFTRYAGRRKRSLRKSLANRVTDADRGSMSALRRKWHVLYNKVHRTRRKRNNRL